MAATQKAPASESDGWSASLIADGLGYRYTAEHGGVIWAQGWVRAAPAGADPATPRERASWYQARELVLAIGKLAQATGAAA